MLQRGEVQPIGARHSFRVDVRDHRREQPPLLDLVASRAISARNSITPRRRAVALPAAAQPAGDIPALARHFLARIGEQPGLRELGITDGALALLAAYDWPGNVRQLQAVLFRAAVFCDGDALTAADFPQPVEPARRGSAAASPVQEGVGVML